RSKFEWIPSPELIEIMEMDTDLLVGQPMSDKQRASLIDLYAPIGGLDYRPPDAVPSAYHSMTDAQRSHDQSLKSTQYLLSAVFRPLDSLAHALHTSGIPEANNYLQMLFHNRALLLNASHSINHYRNTIAIKSANKSFKPDLLNDQRYTMPVDRYNNLIGELHASQKVLRDA
ncbi:hypothetical protein BD560DRAFT_314009, partial [Blakeslea trispora]